MNSSRDYKPEGSYKPGPFGAKPRFSSDRPSISDLINDFKTELNKLRADINSLSKLLNPSHVSTTQGTGLEELSTQDIESPAEQSTQN
jgi:hypothetical protein